MIHEDHLTYHANSAISSGSKMLQCAADPMRNAVPGSSGAICLVTYFL